MAGTVEAGRNAKLGGTELASFGTVVGEGVDPWLNVFAGFDFLTGGATYTGGHAVYSGYF